MTEQLCQRTIVEKDWTGHKKRKCGAKATRTLPCGLPVCGGHWKKWSAKMEKRRIRTASNDVGEAQ